MQSMTQAVIHLDNLKNNLNIIRDLLPEGTPLCPAVKANAYGHGAVRISRFLKDQGVEYLAIARVEEGIELRLAGIEGPLILFGHSMPSEINKMIRYDITPMAGDLSYLKALQEEGEKQKKNIGIHLKIDTGMGRIGCDPQEAVKLAQFIQRSSRLNQQGLCTHFPIADSPLEDDKAFTEEQVKQLLSSAQAITQAGGTPGLVHAANSGGIIQHKDSHLQLVRPGIMLYGYLPDSRMAPLPGLKPVMELEAPVIFIKQINRGESLSYGRTWKAPTDRIIATLPIGYADGYSRNLSNGTPVWINGQTYPIAGRVCMDQLMLDLGETSSVKCFDRAVLFGPTKGAPGADDLAEKLGTISYEITCGVSSRVPRIYKEV